MEHKKKRRETHPFRQPAREIPDRTCQKQNKRRRACHSTPPETFQTKNTTILRPFSALQILRKTGILRLRGRQSSVVLSATDTHHKGCAALATLRGPRLFCFHVPSITDFFSVCKSFLEIFYLPLSPSCAVMEGDKNISKNKIRK